MPAVDSIPSYIDYVSSEKTSFDTAFNSLLLIGKGNRGQPYNDISTSPLKLLEQQNDVNSYYGKDSDIATAFGFFKKHGGQKAYCLNASPATKGTGWLLDGSGEQLIFLTAANWGDWSADISIRIENYTTYVVITITDSVDQGIKIISDELTSLATVLEFFNVTGEDYFTAQQQVGLSSLPAAFNSTFSSVYDYATGTNPDPTADDYESIISALPEWIKQYVIYYICPIVDLTNSGQHAVYLQFRDLAIQQRQSGYPIQIICGGTVGDHVLEAGDVTDPLYRSGIYNNQDVLFCAPGVSNLGAYISFAPAIAGLLNKHPIGHNLTADEISAWKLATTYSATDLETLVNAGVISIITNKNSYNICKGINTLQNNDLIWNVTSKATILPSQRAIVDFVQKTFREDLERSVGSDGVTDRQLLSRCNYLWDSIATNPNLFGRNLADSLLPYRVDRIERVGGEAWEIALAFIPVSQTNFIGITVSVYTNY